MNPIMRNPKNNKLKYDNIAGEMMFSNIIERVDNEEELKFVVKNLCTDLETVVHDWYLDNDKDDGFDHCNIEVYFETED